MNGAPRYRIQLSTSSSMSNATYHRFYGKSGTISGLKSGTTYYAKIRTIEDDGTNLSNYSSSVKIATKTAAASAAKTTRGHDHDGGGIQGGRPCRRASRSRSRATATVTASA